MYIYLSDVNDEKPQFKLSRYQFNISENEPSGSRVGHVTAEDRDSEPNNAITYGLVMGHVSSDMFAIDISSGLITTLQQLDRETQGLHQVKLSYT